MSIEAVRGLRNRWRADPILSGALEQAFDRIGFSEAYVQRCLEHVTSGRAPRRSKDIKDNVWGMIELGWPTLRLLDSPIIQRLRGIKQLGLSYLTYPSAEHSRFAHSLGIGNVVTRFLDICTKRQSDGLGEGGFGTAPYVALNELEPLKSNDILHAAILHDCGHMPFSHASEGVLASRDEVFLCGGRPVADFLFDLEDELEKNVDLSEAISIAITLSARFEAFYKNYILETSADEDVLLRISSLIAGLPPTEKLAGVADIISSAAVDADKIDYINRDALACGIPIGVDVARLFLRSGFVRATRDQLARVKENPASEEIHFVVNSSGMDTLEEITQARAGLYQRVYLHSATRTAEALLRRALNAHQGIESPQPLHDALDLWVLNDSTLLDILRKSDREEARLLALRILTRDLPKKACAFSALIAETHMPFDIFLPRLSASEYTTLRKHITNTALGRLIGSKLPISNTESIEEAVRREAQCIADAIPDEHAASLRPKSDLGLVLLVGGAYLQSKKKDCLVLQGGELLPASDFTTVEEQQDATDIFKAIGFVMCDPEWRPIVLAAARTVIFRLEQGIRPTSLPTQRPTGTRDDAASTEADNAVPIKFVRRTLLNLDSVVRRSHVPRPQVDNLMLVLEEARFFDDEPLLARRVPPQQTEVVRIASRLGKFSGERSWQVRPETVAAFLDQFPPRLRIPMRKALLDLQFLDDAIIADSILQSVVQVPDADIVPLSPSSGTHVWNVLKREAASRGILGLAFFSDISHALKRRSDRPIVLVDDNVASATQARAQFFTWMGMPPDTWPKELHGEEGVFPFALAKSEQAGFKARLSSVAVCASLPTSNDVLSDCATSLGLAQFKGVTSAMNLTGVQWPEELKEFLEEVGYQLLLTSKFAANAAGVSEEEEQFCRNMAFGYGNIGGLTATSTNVPSSTVTALWSPGVYKGSPWMPLMIRQKKMRWLVLG